MNKATLTALTAAVMVLSAGATALLPARAQTPAPPPAWPHNAREAKAFVDAMPADTWTLIAKQSFDFTYLVGKPIVAVINPADETLATITCDGKWVLVGPKPYLSGAPASIGGRKIGFIPTDGFDSYCKQSISAVTPSGERLAGTLSIPGDFKNSVSIVVAPTQ